MDHHVPKRRIAVTLWSHDRQGMSAHVFLDLDARGEHHPTVLDMLNQTTPFMPVVVGEEGRVHLVQRRHLIRVTGGRDVIASDLYARGFQEWREERVEALLSEGTRLSGRVWMPIDRDTQRLSDYLNQLGNRFFVLITPVGTHLVSAAAVSRIELDEGSGASLGEHAVGSGWADLPRFTQDTGRIGYTIPPRL